MKIFPKTLQLAKEKGFTICKSTGNEKYAQRENLRKWIREEFNIHFIIIPVVNLVDVEYWCFISKGVFNLSKLNDSDFFCDNENFIEGKFYDKAFENALWACLLKAK